MNDLINILATVVRASSHQFVGRLGRDPEIRFLESGTCVANASIAINRPGAKKNDGLPPDWFKIEIWGEQGQAFADGCHKGDLIEVVGRVKTNRWTDSKTGEEKMDLVITADRWSLVPPAGTAAPAPPAAPAPAPAPAPTPAATFADGCYKNDIPF